MTALLSRAAGRATSGAIRRHPCRDAFAACCCALLASFVLLACTEVHGTDLDAEADAASDGGLDATRDAGDAVADAHPWGLDPAEWAAEYPPCNATEIQLPPTGETLIFDPHHMNGKVVYSDYRDWDNYFADDIFMYDLATCVEYRVTRKYSAQYTPFIWEDEITFASADESNSNLILMLFDTKNLEFLPLLSQSFGSQPRYNGSYVVYDSYDETTLELASHLTLWDLVTDEEVRLAEDWQGAEDVSLSPTHAAWVAWGGPDKDVFFVDLETRDITHIESTWDPYTAFSATWGDWVLWEDHRNGSSDVYGWRISTSEEVRLTDNGAWNGRPTLRGSLACYRTSLYNPTTGWDLVVRDLETGIERRVTREPHVGYKCGEVDSGWLVYQKQTGGDYWLNTIHAVDLVAAGILDPSGQHVVPE